MVRYSLFSHGLVQITKVPSPTPPPVPPARGSCHGFLDSPVEKGTISAPERDQSRGGYRKRSVPYGKDP